MEGWREGGRKEGRDRRVNVRKGGVMGRERVRVGKKGSTTRNKVGEVKNILQTAFLTFDSVSGVKPPKTRSEHDRFDPFYSFFVR